MFQTLIVKDSQGNCDGTSITIVNPKLSFKPLSSKTVREIYCRSGMRHNADTNVSNPYRQRQSGKFGVIVSMQAK